MPFGSFRLLLATLDNILEAIRWPLVAGIEKHLHLVHIVGKSRAAKGQVRSCNGSTFGELGHSCWLQFCTFGGYRLGRTLPKPFLPLFAIV